MLSRVARGLAITCVVAVRTAAADPSERTDRQRAYQLAPIGVGAAVYFALEFGLKDAITPKQCRWCEPNRLDDAVRRAWVWDDDSVPTAHLLSNLTGYVGNPLLALGGLVLTTIDDRDKRRWFDDTVPVVQAAVVTGLVNQTVKVIAGRKRPFAYYHGRATRNANDVNTSFFSGHTALAFAVTTASGTVAHLRGYSSEAALWIGGSLLATVTGYLRVAADAHYFTDVVAGGLVGAGVGVAIPLLFHREVLTDEPAIQRLPNTARERPVIFSFGGSF